MKTLRRIAILFFGVVFAISLFMLARILVQGRQEQAAFDRLSAALEQPESADGQNPEQSPYEALKAQNPDFFGWISIEGTNIDYPVMFTPDDPEYYLRRAFDGSSSQSGVPFLAADCFEGGGNWLIYGHNMKNGSMFADLMSYAQEDFWQEHPLIRFDTLEQQGSYEVLAAFYREPFVPICPVALAQCHRTVLHGEWRTEILHATRNAGISRRFSRDGKRKCTA